MFAHFAEFVDDRSFDPLESKDLMCDLDVEGPVEERYVVADIKPMPEGTCRNDSQLCQTLLPLSFLLGVVGLGEVHVFIDIAEFEK